VVYLGFLGLSSKEDSGCFSYSKMESIKDLLSTGTLSAYFISIFPFE
jgi:hypothetical protein